MRTTLATLALVLALVFAGCSGGGSGTPATPGPAETATDGAGATPVPLTDDHPYITDGQLDARALVTAHVQRLRGLDSYTLGNNVTAVVASNGSTAGRAIRVDRVDLADQESARVLRRYGSDGTVQQERVGYRNATHTCSGTAGSVTCGEAAFDERRVVSLALETTALETVGAPAFEPDGTVTRDGQGLYRYTATSFRDDLSERTLTELGTDPVMGEATLVVHPSGRVVEYRITYTSGRDGDRQRGTFVYTTRGVNATTVPDLAALASE